MGDICSAYCWLSCHQPLYNLRGPPMCQIEKCLDSITKCACVFHTHGPKKTFCYVCRLTKLPVVNLSRPKAATHEVQPRASRFYYFSHENDTAQKPED